MLSENHVLALESRRTVYLVVENNPGAHFRAIERSSGLSLAVVKHNLDYLAKQHIVRSENDGRNLRYYPVSFGSDATHLMNLLRQKSTRQVLLCLLVKPFSFQSLTARTGLAPSTISESLKKLRSSRVIRSYKQGREMYYALSIDANDLVRLMITYRTSFLDALVDRIAETWEF